MYNLDQERQFFTPRWRYVVFNPIRGLQFKSWVKSRSRINRIAERIAVLPTNIGLLRDFALSTQKENGMLEDTTTVLDSLVESVTESALETLRGHLKKEGICEEALRLLDNVVILTEERYIVKSRELHWESVAESIHVTLPVVTRDIDALGGWERDEELCGAKE